jgi:2-C-methyl-D-erythritol 4-phosphate cytidylyltransferase/2-C-methyl-D-erythritol 2,4-cyclodiphosphate synthase
MTSNKTDLPRFHVLIPAAGSGSRTGLSYPKQFHKIAGKTLLEHTIEKFITHPQCVTINVIIDPQDAKAVHGIKTSAGIDKIITGGKERKDSIINGLKELSNLNNKDIILIHDAARPHINHDDIDQILTAFGQGHKAITLAKPLADSLIDHKSNYPDRSRLFALQTPQAFYYGDILKAATENSTQNTEETSLMAAAGFDIHIVTAKHYNDKITTAQDIMIAEALLHTPTETRIGQGYDVHAFETAPSDRKLILCGIEVDYPLALKGHSNADVGLHAITDAILGAIAQGDIGRHFPPSDPTFKNMDSAIFLEKARDLVIKKGGSIVNVDLTLICEHPKITPYAEKMIARVADILNIDANRVSIKATTSEKLGFTGRGEGIAAQAIATVKVPA